MKRKNLDKNPFSTPKGYFDNFEDNLMAKLSKETSRIPENTGFTVPPSYFDDFQSKLNAKLKKDTEVKNDKKVKVIQLKPYKKFIGIAASIAALVLMAIGIDWNSKDAIEFADIANSDIESYFENHDLDLSVDEIAEVIPVDGMEIYDFIDISMNEENILDYLNENVEDIEELNIENNE
ncbi:hypothetical protein J8L85_10215 [Maribacter sp. MMG018]|uniref:hypothetical protein n=1 Tax=Maribacter sp. MMG018 TaxID=2822688 RepID=UPI001B36594F|nr:hypothetical protein [Maribacter sp. MMG018]MBQ4914811.1 hypothetical protein [Maribacter sp. MMG018]